ncbi:alpha-amylase [Bavariicoccus seileri]|uniref:alpha-amylase n=1 Tax=Bavariicoccus seileri TaxID=549685 RepID=UPI003F92C778
MTENRCIMQYFEWYVPADGKHWERLEKDAEHLKSLGIDRVWLPPMYKGTSDQDVGYGVYDLYDLGEFDQKGTIRTKYGTKEQLLSAIKALKSVAIDAIADVVLNHKAGADETESFLAVEVDATNRQKTLGDPHQITAWTKFTFPGRHDQYSPFKWNFHHFSGVDFDAETGHKGIYMIQNDQSGWTANEDVDTENGNYDYLMFADIKYQNQEVVDETKKWVAWVINETGVNGFRLDAIKHISFDFIADLVKEIEEKQGSDFYIFGEYWRGDYHTNEEYLEETNFEFDLVDVKLHLNFHQASQQGASYDLRQILNDSLMQKNPTHAVTFVDNHDSQPHQALESYVEPWFKPLAYALILLRSEGYPCLFYGDYYGISGDEPIEGNEAILDRLLKARLKWAYGEQNDYALNEHTIGFTRLGDDAHQHGLVVVMSNQDEGDLEVDLGELNKQTTYYDWTTDQEPVTTDDEGRAAFHFLPGKVSVYAPEAYGS